VGLSQTAPACHQHPWQSEAVCTWQTSRRPSLASGLMSASSGVQPCVRKWLQLQNSLLGTQWTERGLHKLGSCALKLTASTVVESHQHLLQDSQGTAPLSWKVQLIVQHIYQRIDPCFEKAEGPLELRIAERDAVIIPPAARPGVAPSSPPTPPSRPCA
jgi:hypothetical protein